MIVNLQRKIAIDLPSIRTFATIVRSRVSEVQDSDFSVALVSDRRMKELNRFFRGKDSTTDVLSFPHEPDEFDQSTGLSSSLSNEAGAGTFNENYLGDIVISVEQAQKQAAENGLTLENEIQQLILHGVLHLCGYDHEIDDGEMNKRELQLRRQIGI